MPLGGLLVEQGRLTAIIAASFGEDARTWTEETIHAGGLGSAHLVVRNLARGGPALLLCRAKQPRRVIGRIGLLQVCRLPLVRLTVHVIISAEAKIIKVLRCFKLIHRTTNYADVTANHFVSDQALSWRVLEWLVSDLASLRLVDVEKVAATAAVIGYAV